MIIHRYWTTRRKRKRPRKYEHMPSPTLEYTVAKWRGWFLFGIIPLYVHCIGVTYERT